LPCWGGGMISSGSFVRMRSTKVLLSGFPATKAYCPDLSFKKASS
jgi:hypothetical protein